MATQEQEMQVTRTSFTLRKPDDWSKWLFTRKTSADRNSLWEYVNPDLLPERLEKLENERLVELEVRRFRNPQPEEQINIPDLTATELATYNSWARRFDWDEARWLTKEKPLRNLSLEIVQTIDIKHLDLILSCTDAHDLLKTLKKHLCPSIRERNHQLRAQYPAVCTRSKRANLDSWFNKWVTVTRLLTEANMPEIAGNRAQEEFILSIRGLDDSWAATQLQDLIKKEQKDENFPQSRTWSQNKIVLSTHPPDSVKTWNLCYARSSRQQQWPRGFARSPDRRKTTVKSSYRLRTMDAKVSWWRAP
jgi:hypothetical protein